MDWSKIKLPRRGFLRVLGTSALTFLATDARAQMHKLSPTANEVMPVIYIPHGGGPCFFMDWTMGPKNTWDGMALWLKQLAATLPQKPKAMVVISAHWEEKDVTVNTASRPPLLYDYYGFPPHTYKIQYPAPGSPAVAARVGRLLTEAGIKNHTTSSRGLDHGVFIPLKLVYPQADIPIVQVSLRAGLDPAFHLGFGQALAPLRQEGVLIVGSGMSYHNLSRFGPGNETIAESFDKWLNETVCHSEPQKRNQLLTEWTKAPEARRAHPREEHLIPLMVAAGAAAADRGKRIYSQSVMGLAISGFSFC